MTIELESTVVTLDEIQRTHRCEAWKMLALLKGEKRWRLVMGVDMATTVVFEFCPYCHCDLGDLKNSEVLKG